MSDDDTNTAVAGFVFNSSAFQIVFYFAVTFVALGIVLALFILGAAAWIYSCEAARSSVDRISFRLMLWSMAFELVYGTCNISENFKTTQNQPMACTVVMYFLLSSMAIVNYLFTCIGINLMLVMCFGLDPSALRLERWYIGISIFLGVVIELVPACLGHLGLDTTVGGCYFATSDANERTKNLMVDLYAWQLLSCFISLVCVIMTVTTIVKQGRTTSRIIFKVEDPSECSKSGIFHRSICALKRGRGCRRDNNSMTSSKRRSLGRLEDQFSIIILRITMYPICLLLVNVFISLGDIYVNHFGITSVTSEVLFFIHYCLYCSRGAIFALIGIFVDPTLRRGLRVAWNFRRGKESLTSNMANYNSTHDDNTANSGSKGVSSMQEMAFEQALNVLMISENEGPEITISQGHGLEEKKLQISQIQYKPLTDNISPYPLISNLEGPVPQPSTLKPFKGFRPRVIISTSTFGTSVSSSSSSPPRVPTSWEGGSRLEEAVSEEPEISIGNEVEKVDDDGSSTSVEKRWKDLQNSI